MTPGSAVVLTGFVCSLGVAAITTNHKLITIKNLYSTASVIKRANFQEEEQQDTNNLHIAHTVCSSANTRQLMVTLVPYRKFPFSFANIDTSRGGLQVNIYCSRPIEPTDYIRRAISPTVREESDMLIYQMPYSTELFVPKYGKDFFGECLMATYPKNNPHKLCDVTVWLGLGKSAETGDGLVARYGLDYSIRAQIQDINITLQSYFASLSNISSPYHPYQPNQ